MKQLPLLSHHFKKIGWIIFIPSLILGVLLLIFHWNFEEIRIPVFYYSGQILISEKEGFFKLIYVDWFSNVIAISILIGGMIIGFSEEKIEDEFIFSLRLKSILWSLKWSYLIVIVLFILIFGILFLSIMIIAVFLPLILYIFRFHYMLLRNKNEE